MLVYTSSREHNNNVAMARVAAAGRIAAERAALRRRQEAHDALCDCRLEGYAYCEDYPRR